ncbi:MAG: TatD family hydrolase [Flavobacteriales bacterium]
MQFVDTHTHLFSDQFSEDIDETIKRAKDAHVSKLFLPNIDAASIQPMMRLVEDYPEQCFPMMGLHPCSVKNDFKLVLDQMKRLLDRHKFYAIGETGLDLNWDKSTLDIQVQALKVQIDWAKEYDLPIVIHARESYDELFDVFDELNDDNLKGVFHCFTGTLAQAEHIIGYGGFKLGLGGVLTFKNSGLSETIADIDMKDLVLETDSPYLAPTPHRGKRNESSYLYYVASKLAEVKQITMEEVAKITSRNALDLFQLKE